MIVFEAISLVIDRYNSNPFNPKKFYYECRQLKDKDNNTRFEIKFGVSHNQAITLVEIDFGDKDNSRAKDMVYTALLEHILTNAYDHLDVQK